MRIAVLGLGNVGGALARLWIAAGHQVSAVKRKDHGAAEQSNISYGAPAEIAAAADVIALCVPWPAVEAALASCGDLTGKILIDCTNPVTSALDGLALGGATSAAEQIQALEPGASVVKALNSLGAALLGNADFDGEPADGFFCGDDAAAKSTVEKLIAAAGLHPVDVGSLRNARYLEALAMLWIDMAVHQRRGPTFAFTLAERRRAEQA